MFRCNIISSIDPCNILVQISDQEFFFSASSSALQRNVCSSSETLVPHSTGTMCPAKSKFWFSLTLKQNHSYAFLHLPATNTVWFWTKHSISSASIFSVCSFIKCTFSVCFFANACLQRWQVSALRPVQRLNVRLTMTPELENLSQCQGPDNIELQYSKVSHFGIQYTCTSKACFDVENEKWWKNRKCLVVENGHVWYLMEIYEKSVWWEKLSGDLAEKCLMAAMLWLRGWFDLQERVSPAPRPPVLMHTPSSTSSTSRPRPASQRTLPGQWSKHPQPISRPVWAL